MGKPIIYPKVIVVGGGPAGCAAAYTLAKESIDVTVFEQGQPGKDKVCGDALVPSAIELLNLFGINRERIKTLGGYYFNRVDLYVNELLLRQAESDNKAGWVIPRAIIDQEMRNATAKHVSLQYETHVTDLTIESTGNPKLSLALKDGTSSQIECDAVILATGSRNRLSKKLSIDGKPRKAFAITMYVEMNQPDTLILQFFNFYESSYRWVFPISERLANIGICILDKIPEVNLKLLGEELLREYAAKPIGNWRGGWGPLWSGLGQCWHHPSGIVSCGDAAGLVNPYSGEGITAALRSGEQAGKAILNYLAENHNTVQLEKYTKWVTEYFSQKYKKIALY